MKKIIFALSILFLLATNAHATVWFVDTTATGAVNGTSWVNAYTNLQPAINAAQNGDQIWVAAGTYSGNFDLGSKPLYIYGGFSGGETDLTTQRIKWREYETILDGAGGVTLKMNGNNASIIDGFTIQNGVGEGAGIALYASCPRLSNLIIKNNQGRGAALFIEGSKLYYPTKSVQIVNVEISNNNYTRPPWHSTDGVISIYSSDVQIYNTTITANQPIGKGTPLSINAQSDIYLYNSIIWNSGDIYNDGNGNTAYSHSSLIDGSGGSLNWGLANVIIDDGGNLDKDPLFYISPYGGYYLTYGSPAIQAGDLSHLFMYEFWDFDLDTNPRYDLNMWTLDMGAYQTQSGSFAPQIPKQTKEKISVEKLSNHINIYPTLLRKGEYVTIEVSSETLSNSLAVSIYTLEGKLYSSETINNGVSSILMPNTSGIYIVVLKSGEIVLRKEKITILP